MRSEPIFPSSIGLYPGPELVDGQTGLLWLTSVIGFLLSMTLWQTATESANLSPK
jgi:hypothetical protein